MKLKKRKALITMLATITAITTGCSSGGGSNSSAQKPVEGMTLKLSSSTALVRDGGVGKPWSNISFTTAMLFQNIFIATPGSNNVEAGLAESYTVSDDGLTYEIIFKEDAFWTDGEQLDLEDVVFSIQTALITSGVNNVFTSAFLNISGAEEFKENPSIGMSGLAVDGYTLTITLDKPIATFAQVLAQFAILPEHILGNEDPETLLDNDFWFNPVTSGIYKMGEHISEESLEYVYNDLFNGDAPYIESLLLRADYSPEDLDYYDTNDISQILDYRSVSNMSEYSVDNLFYRYFVFNIDKGGEADPVMSDIRVRQALTYAIDRETLVRDIYYNTGNIINTGVVMDYNKPLDVDYPYDPEIAKQLLEDANYDFNRPINLLHYYKDDTSIKFMEEIAGYLQAIGLKTELVGSGNLYNDEFDSYDMGLKGLSAFDVAEWYKEYESVNQMHTNVFGGEPMFDDLIDELDATTTQEDKIAVLQKLQQLEYDLLYKYPIFSMGHMAYVSNSVILPEGLEFGNPKYKYDLNISEWSVNNSSK